MVQNASDDTDSVDNHFRGVAASRLNIANNVITKRKEQLKEWEESEMNKIAPIRRPVDRSKVKFQDSDVFLSACVSGDEEEVDDLLDKGANINTATIDGVTALHQAVIDGKIETISFLLDRGADIDAQDNEGWTPLHAACCCASLPIVKLLCGRNADLTIVNSDKELAIDLAEEDEIRQYLEDQFRKQKIDIDECKHREFNMMMKDCTEWIRCGKYLDKPHAKTGATALHVAASKGYNQLIGMLIRAGANVHVKDFEGWTPLHAAAHWGEKDACRILMEHGAKLTDKNFAGQDVIKVADKSVVEYLEELATKPLKPSTTSKSSYIQISQSASHVLQPTTNTSTILPGYKRASVPRLSTGEKLLLAKKDEQDENVTLIRGVEKPSSSTGIRSPITSPPPLSPSPVVLTTLPKEGSPERSISPPPIKKPSTIELEKAQSPKEKNNVIFRNYQPEKSDSNSSLSSQRSTPSVNNNKFRRSQIVRSNRRVTGPVDFEALSAATEVLAEKNESNELAKKFANVTIRKREENNTPQKTFTTPNKSYQESQQNATSSTSSVNNSQIRVSTPVKTNNVSTFTVNGSLPNVSSDSIYKQLYEKEKEENEKLRKQLNTVNYKHSNLSNGSSRSSNLNDQERKSLERKIAELEYELEKELKCVTECTQLKAENDALIKLLSKLSRPITTAPRKQNNYKQITKD